MRNKTGLVALVVLAAATLLMVFFVLPNMDRKKPDETPVTTEVQAPAENEAAAGETKTADGKQGRATPAGEAAATQDAAKPAEEAATAEETAKAEPAPADPAASWVVPAFDLLRVEPDGSTVIAGRAQPNTTIEIRNGDTVVATADVGPSGDFAAVFDKPLAAGDYQLTLNASDGKGGANASQEVATVSIPKDSAGELLAMVSKPGEASRLITVPETAVAETEEKPAGEAASAAVTETPAAGAETPAVTEDAAKTATPDARATADVRVAAVELEGDRMFIAGNARPGALVRIYADDKLVGEMKADEAGRYVVDGKIDLPVGRHTIRADVMSADGSKVELRASVPFDRPEGEQVAVVAQADSTPQATPALGLVGGGAFDKLRSDAAKALSLLKGLFADGRAPTLEELAAARSATEIALSSLAEFKPGAEEGDAARETAAKASAAAGDALARLQALPREAEAVGAALGSIETAVASALAPAAEGSRVETESASGEAATPAVATEQATAGEPETVEQAPLQASKTSVIIRRGDTLWQISRRIYGKGVRYTTIYLANQDQINDPDRIVPGQVFGVPGEATESDADAEAQHRRHMRGN